MLSSTVLNVGSLYIFTIVLTYTSHLNWLMKDPTSLITGRVL